MIREKDLFAFESAAFRSPSFESAAFRSPSTNQLSSASGGDGTSGTKGFCQGGAGNVPRASVRAVLVMEWCLHY
jgi:hypothetical protein